jgi:hypothetical protein
VAAEPVSPQGNQTQPEVFRAFNHFWAKEPRINVNLCPISVTFAVYLFSWVTGSAQMPVLVVQHGTRITQFFFIFYFF